MNEFNLISDDTNALNYQVEYGKWVKKFKEEKQYDTIFYDFYQAGLFLVDGEERSVDDYYVLLLKEGDQTLYYIDYLGDNPLKNTYEILKIIPLKDTTIFGKFYQQYKGEIKNNQLCISPSMMSFLKEHLQKWDGTLHKSVPETMARSIFNLSK